jgi:hypothetical protein
MGIFDKLFGRRKEVASTKNQMTDDVISIEKEINAFLENNSNAIARLTHVKNGISFDEAGAGLLLAARIIKGAGEFWLKRMQEFQVKMLENEMKIVLGLLNGECLVIPTPKSGRTTAIGLEILTRYVAMSREWPSTFKQIWVVEDDAFDDLLRGEKHSVMRAFLGEFGLKLLNGDQLLYVGKGGLPKIHKYGNIIPVFSNSKIRGHLQGYELRDHWEDISEVRLDCISYFNFNIRCFGGVGSYKVSAIASSESDARYLASRGVKRNGWTTVSF